MLVLLPVGIALAAAPDTLAASAVAAGDGARGALVAAGVLAVLLALAHGGAAVLAGALVTWYEVAQSLVETVSAVQIAFGAAAALAASAMLSRASFGGATEDAAGNGWLVAALIWGICTVCVAALGFVAGWRERRSLLEAHMWLLGGVLLPLTCAVFAALATRGTAAFVDDHCADILEFVGADWFGEVFNCTKYADRAAEFPSDLAGCVGGGGVASTYDDVFDRDFTKGDLTVAWETCATDAAAVANGTFTAVHVGGCQRGGSACLVSCVDPGCCRRLKEAVAALETVLAIGALLFVFVLLATLWCDRLLVTLIDEFDVDHSGTVTKSEWLLDTDGDGHLTAAEAAKHRSFKLDDAAALGFKQGARLSAAQRAGAAVESPPLPATATRSRKGIGGAAVAYAAAVDGNAAAANGGYAYGADPPTTLLRHQTAHTTACAAACVLLAALVAALLGAAGSSGGATVLKADDRAAVCFLPVPVHAEAPPTPGCADGQRNGEETDTDCGGETCRGLDKRCGLGGLCRVNGDCVSHYCMPAAEVAFNATANPGGRGVCARVKHCDNGVRDGGETDTDCGGPTCKRCETGLHCARNADCGSGRCDKALRICISCSDNLANGDETAVDCGGCGYCDPCAAGKRCVSDCDCAGALVCVPPGAGCSGDAAVAVCGPAPTPAPTPVPTASPVVTPTASPSASPSFSPSASPSASPTASPTPPAPVPVLAPTAVPPGGAGTLRLCFAAGAYFDGLGAVPLHDVGGLAPLRVCGTPPPWFDAWLANASRPGGGPAPGEHCNVSLAFSWDPSKLTIARRTDPPAAAAWGGGSGGGALRDFHDAFAGRQCTFALDAAAGTLRVRGPLHALLEDGARMITAAVAAGLAGDATAAARDVVPPTRLFAVHGNPCGWAAETTYGDVGDDDLARAAEAAQDALDAAAADAADAARAADAADGGAWLVSDQGTFSL